MTSSGEANPGGSPSPPPFREPRLPSIFGKRRGDDSQRLAAELAETWSRARGEVDGQVRCPPRSQAGRAGGQ
jgi:alkanesulfonate monooxygenase SsuD/methylene tetrahydromethanopterin reductase-like flavin-dependent oxidoreductase (luciferase family)